MKSFCFLLAVACCCLCVFSVQADDWPQWRGPEFKSISKEQNLPVEFGKDKNLAWRLPLPGPAGASPIVFGDRVFVTSVQGDKLLLICVSTGGEQLWSRELKGSNQDVRDGANSASASPCTDGEHVWVMMGNGFLSCFTIDGEPVWVRDLQQDYGRFNIQFGMSSTPLLDRGNLYLALMHGDMRDATTGSVGQIISLDARTGNENWLHLRKTDGTAENKHSYASPTLYRDDQHEFLITHGADYVIAHSLIDGSEVWRCGGFNPKGDSYNQYLRLVASPVCGDGVVIAPTAKRGPVLAIEVDRTGDLTAMPGAVKWRTDRVTPDVATPVIYQNRVYLAGERGDLTCLNLETGAEVYRERLMSDKHRSTPVAADGKLYIADRSGDVIVLQAGDEMTVLAKNRLEEETQASPAIANGVIYIRTFEALYAFKKN